MSEQRTLFDTTPPEKAPAKPAPFPRVRTERRRRVRLTPLTELTPTPEEPPFLRPARRTRARRARRGPLWRAILLLELTAAAAVVLVALWTAYARVMAYERLRVGRVEVRGGRFLSEGEVRELLGAAVGENILALDIDALKARLRASPWVADASVTRTLPDTLRVEIRERRPLALAEVERLYLMDAEGVLIDMYGPRTAGFDLPIVRGLAKVDSEARRDRAERAGALLDDLGELASEVSEVEVEASGDLRVVLKGAGEVLRLGAPPHRSRLLTFLSLRKELAERCPQAEYFDLRFRDRIYAKDAAAVRNAETDAKPGGGSVRPAVAPDTANGPVATPSRQPPAAPHPAQADPEARGEGGPARTEPAHGSGNGQGEE